MKTLGARIRELREERDLSLRELGAAFVSPSRPKGLTAAFLSDIELGRRYPSDEVLAKMASILGVSKEELRRHDARLPVEELRRLAETTPAYGVAFRQVIQSRVSPEKLMELAEETRKTRKKP
jgi:transcriptional regulator with XRE-family HTH domain